MIVVTSKNCISLAWLVKKSAHQAFRSYIAKENQSFVVNLADLDTNDNSALYCLNPIHILLTTTFLLIQKFQISLFGVTVNFYRAKSWILWN